jgi:hypothetical protein
MKPTCYRQHETIAEKYKNIKIAFTHRKLDDVTHLLLMREY